jgi:hypothetical protein
MKEIQKTINCSFSLIKNKIPIIITNTLCYFIHPGWFGLPGKLEKIGLRWG